MVKRRFNKNCLLLYKFNLFPKFFGVNWLYLFIQRNEGDVTVTPKARPSDYLHLLENLDSKGNLETKVRRMERRTYQKLPYIRNRMRIEKQLT
eukprot:UN13170